MGLVVFGRCSRHLLADKEIDSMEQVNWSR